MTILEQFIHNLNDEALTKEFKEEILNDLEHMSLEDVIEKLKRNKVSEISINKIESYYEDANKKILSSIFEVGKRYGDEFTIDLLDLVFSDPEEEKSLSVLDDLMNLTDDLEESNNIEDLKMLQTIVELYMSIKNMYEDV